MKQITEKCGFSNMTDTFSFPQKQVKPRGVTTSVKCVSVNIVDKRKNVLVCTLLINERN